MKTTRTKGRKPPGKQNVTPLRERAESLLKKRFDRENPEELSDLEAHRLIHELHTYQIELELQNEELRTAQIALLEAKDRYADLYDFAPVGYFTFNRDGVVLDVNLTGASMLGIERARLTGKPFVLHIFKSGARDYRTIFSNHLKNALKTGEPQACELELARKNGTLFFAALDSSPSDGEMLRTAVSDITGRRTAEDALRLRTAELEAVNKELEAYSYTISHDLKSPLRSIEGFTRALAEDYGDRLDDTARDYLQRANGASLKMSELIDALLTMARQTKRELVENTVDLSQMARIVADVLKRKEPERTVEFVIAGGLKARGDRAMLELAMQNLIQNAWKFTGRHKSARIEFGAIELDAARTYYVRDDGAGFNMKYADKLFSPFSRFHSNSEFSGVGIGLATVYLIIRKHGGKIWAESRPKEGTTVYFTLG